MQCLLSITIGIRNPAATRDGTIVRTGWMGSYFVEPRWHRSGPSSASRLAFAFYFPSFLPSNLFSHSKPERARRRKRRIYAICHEAVRRRRDTALNFNFSYEIPGVINLGLVVFSARVPTYQVVSLTSRPRIREVQRTGTYSVAMVVGRFAAERK